MDKPLEQIEKELKAPFKPEDIEWRVGSTNSDKTKGLALAYVTNRAIMNRLDEVFGIAGWKNEFKDWKGNGVLCGISCLINGEWLTKWDGAEETNMEATKGGLSDAMKRAGYQWGIGRYLYKLDSQWVPIEQRGKSYVIKAGQEPKLPSWALPEGYKAPEKPIEKTSGNPSENTSDATKLENTPGYIPYISEDLAKNAISEPQQRRLFAIAKGKEEFAKTVLARYGYKQSKEIQKEHYNDICDEIQAEVKV